MAQVEILWAYLRVARRTPINNQDHHPHHQNRRICPGGDGKPDCCKSRSVNQNVSDSAHSRPSGCPNSIPTTTRQLIKVIYLAEEESRSSPKQWNVLLAQFLAALRYACSVRRPGASRVFLRRLVTDIGIVDVAHRGPAGPSRRLLAASLVQTGGVLNHPPVSNQQDRTG